MYVFRYVSSIIDTLSNLKSGIKKHGFMLSRFLLGIAVGLIGLFGIASMLLEKNSVLIPVLSSALFLAPFRSFGKMLVPKEEQCSRSFPLEPASC